MKIVVSRYNEDVEWTKQFPNVIIYNKGGPLDDIYNAIPMENVGREGHTYMSYIYENYDHLDDYTIFLQGNPFDHSPHIVENIYGLMKYINGGIPEEIWNIDFCFLSEFCVTSALPECPCHPGLPMVEIYEYLFEEKKTNAEFLYGGGAQFIVSKERIRSRPKEFYLKVIQLLNYDIDPIEGFVIERFHGLIFAMDMQTSM
jgi:hypothetical protein